MYAPVLRCALLASFLSAVFVANGSSALARPTGEPQACGNCHYKDQGPQITLTFSNEKPSPGETITITIAIKAVNGEAKRTGFMLQSMDSGKFTLMDAVGTRLHTDTTALHAQPKDLVDGKAEFQVKWTAPSTVGVTEFRAFSITGNSNGKSDDDHNANVPGFVAHGCQGTLYYPDMDMDGFGDKKRPQLSCQPVTDYVLDGRDCKDDDAKVNPDASEACNSADDNCNEAIDENLEPGLYRKDDDGDGYASTRARAVFGCNDLAGHTMKTGDCAPTDPDVHPGADEVPDNGVDDNCNGETDEAGGTGGTGGGDDDGSSDDDESDEDDDDDGGSKRGGCSIGDGRPALGGALLVFALVTGLLRRRRS